MLWRIIARAWNSISVAPEVFDLLSKDDLTRAQTQKVKPAARHLLHRLLEQSPMVLVQDWFKDRQSRWAVRSAVVTVLHADLPEIRDRAAFNKPCDRVMAMMPDYASKGRKWAA